MPSVFKCPFFLIASCFKLPSALAGGDKFISHWLQPNLFFHLFLKSLNQFFFYILQYPAILNFCHHKIDDTNNSNKNYC